MIGWTRLVLATAWIMSASPGCAGATPTPSSPDSVRSPELDYGDGPRSADDGEVMGAQRASPQDWLASGATTGHLGPGWSWRGGQPHFHPEQVSVRNRAAPEPSCPPRSAPLAPEELELHVALQRAWLEAARDPSLPALASTLVELPGERSGFLSCDRR